MDFTPEELERKKLVYARLALNPDFVEWRDDVITPLVSMLTHRAMRYNMLTEEGRRSSEHDIVAAKAIAFHFEGSLETNVYNVAAKRAKLKQREEEAKRFEEEASSY